MCFITLAPTGLGQGDVLAELGLFSLSSGSSTEDIRIFLADRSRLLWTGLDGAVQKLFCKPWSIIEFLYEISNTF